MCSATIDQQTALSVFQQSKKACDDVKSCASCDMILHLILFSANDAFAVQAMVGATSGYAPRIPPREKFKTDGSELLSRTNMPCCLYMQSRAAETMAGAAPQVQRNKGSIKGEVQSQICRVAVQNQHALVL